MAVVEGRMSSTGARSLGWVVTVTCRAWSPPRDFASQRLCHTRASLSGTFFQTLPDLVTPFLSWCFTSTEARWPIRDGDRVGRGRQSEGSTAETVRKRPERPWTAARTMEVLRWCPFATAQRLVHCAIAGYATEGALFISALLSTDAVSALRRFEY